MCSRPQTKDKILGMVLKSSEGQRDGEEMDGNREVLIFFLGHTFVQFFIILD